MVACLIHLYGVYSPQQTGSDVQFPYADKVAHVRCSARWPISACAVGVPARWLLPALVAANAVISELIQHYWLPFRSGDPLDSLADLAGMALGAWLGVRALRAQKPPGTT